MYLRAFQGVLLLRVVLWAFVLVNVITAIIHTTKVHKVLKPSVGGFAYWPLL